MRATSGSLSCSDRYCLSDASVSIDIAHRPGRDLPFVEPDRGRLEEVGQVALGVDLADQRALAAAGRQPGQGGGDGGLADATLTGDEDQFAFEQVDQAARRLPDSRSRSRPGDPRCRC